MVANSETYPKSESKRTTRTKSLTPEMMLEILEEAVNRCKKSGITIGVSPFFADGTQGVVIVLEGVILGDDQHLHLVDDGKAEPGDEA